MKMTSDAVLAWYTTDTAGGFEALCADAPEGEYLITSRYSPTIPPPDDCSHVVLGWWWAADFQGPKWQVVCQDTHHAIAIALAHYSTRRNQS